MGDFGACRVASSGALTAFAVGTLDFTAPEQLQYSHYDGAVDVWALGCILACIAHNSSTPYPGFCQEDTHVVAAVARGTLRPSVPHDHFLHSFVRDCGASDAAVRPPAATLAHNLNEMSSAYAQ